MHYQLVTIDHDDTFYQIVGEVFTAKGAEEGGVLLPPIILDQNRDLPMTGSMKTLSVFGYR